MKQLERSILQTCVCPWQKFLVAEVLGQVLFFCLKLCSKIFVCSSLIRKLFRHVHVHGTSSWWQKLLRKLGRHVQVRGISSVSPWAREPVGSREPVGPWARGRPWARGPVDGPGWARWRARATLVDASRQKPKSLLFAIQFASWPLLLSSCAFCAQMQSVQFALPCRGKAKLGDDHPDTLISVSNLAGVLYAQGHLAEAEPLYREALEKSPGAQLQRSQRDFGQWILSHTLLNFCWVISFLMTGDFRSNT